MKTEVNGGKYVVAVSGGVDSMVLLDLLTKNKPKLDLVVAHFDHGIRGDSYKDRELVAKTASKYNLPFFFEEGHLRSSASEEEARTKRYQFLNKVVKETKAKGLITAHHQDDLIETAVINIIRGTGRRGLSSMINPKVTRPLLGYSKNQIRDYAKKNKIDFREDPTNSDTKYLRNYIRLNIMPKLNLSKRQKIISLINNQAGLNKEIDSSIEGLIPKYSSRLPRLWFNSLDSKSSHEVLAYWLRKNGLNSYDKKSISRLSVSLKTAKKNKKIEVFSGYQVLVEEDNLALTRAER